ncbi:MAG: Rab family GTPase [Wenzhouxiangellaceae bacterium]
MLGNFAVGKSSLVRRYVSGVFDQRYQTTVGVKIDTRRMTVDEQALKLILWDLAGAAGLNANSAAYIQGMSGYLLVADGTRPETLDDIDHIQQQVEQRLGKLPFIVLLNKHDLSEQWAVSDEWLAERRQRGWTIYPSSALDGTNVDTAFDQLARRLITAKP